MTDTSAENVYRGSRFEVVDEDGRVRAVLGQLGEPTSDSASAFGVALFSREGSVRLALSLRDTGPHLFFGANGNTVMELGVNDDVPDTFRIRPFLMLNDLDGAPVVGWQGLRGRHPGAGRWCGITGARDDATTKRAIALLPPPVTVELARRRRPYGRPITLRRDVGRQQRSRRRGAQRTMPTGGIAESWPDIAHIVLTGRSRRRRPRYCAGQGPVALRVDDTAAAFEGAGVELLTGSSMTAPPHSRSNRRSESRRHGEATTWQ